MSVVIRAATIDDIDRCAHLNADRHAEPFEKWRERFVTDLHDANRLFFVAQLNGDVVGYGHTAHHVRADDADDEASPSGYFLSGLLVADDVRRQGIGTLLTNARLEALRECTNVVFYLGAPDNVATMELHARLGFVEVRPVLRDRERYLLFRLDMP